MIELFNYIMGKAKIEEVRLNYKFLFSNKRKFILL
jgi:hypothetical protein